MKVLKISATIFCSLLSAAGIIGAIVGISIGNYGMMGFYLSIAVIFIVLIVLIQVKIKTKHRSKIETIHTDSIQLGSESSDNISKMEDYFSSNTPAEENLPPQEILRDMRLCYSLEQAKSDIRIVNECAQIISTTKKMDTFFYRADLGAQHIFTLRQAEQAKIKGIEGMEKASQDFLALVESQKDRLLKDSFHEVKVKTDSLVIPKAKLNHWNNYLKKLEEHELEFDISCGDTYFSIKSEVESIINQLKNSIK